MALITKASDASIDTSSSQFAPQRPGLTAAEALDSFAPCYIASDGVHMCNGTAADAAAGFDGFTARAYNSGDTNVTLLGIGTRMRYAASGLTPGAKLYMATTAGRLADAVTTGDAVGIVKAVSVTDIRVIRDA